MDEKKLEMLIRRHEAAIDRLIEADRELASLRDDQYVTWEWVCWYLNIGRSTAEKILSEQPIYLIAKDIERFLRSDIIQFAKQKKVKVQERTLFYLQKASSEIESIPDSVKRREEIRAKAELIVMKHIANNDKRIDRRRAWEEKQKLNGKETKSSKNSKSKPR